MDDTPHPLLDAPERYVLGETEDELHIDTAQLNRAAAARLAVQAHMRLLITSRYLDKHIYDNQPFLDAVSLLARRNRRTHVLILVNDPEPLVKYGHRLLQLRERFTSSIFIRKLHAEFTGYNEAFLLADGYGVLHRPHADLYEGVVSFKNPLRVRELVNQFFEMWEPAENDPDLRRFRM